LLTIPFLLVRVYADLDTECLRPTSAVFQAFDISLSDIGNTTSGGGDDMSQVAVFGRIGTDKTFQHSIPNAWMAASPGHPFFLMPLASARAEIVKSRRFLHQLWYDFPSAE
jgi:mannosyltransferase OCH1-like enzyme